ncbi:LuxR family transcriptional regulator [Labrys sp. KB_33_2]|uniref:LuxR family transcriptional regulator n=1 Tax=unclassified Labrys (in: a-proteobacteria) TaxID=2688601 RepID=UPI003EBC2996
MLEVMAFETLHDLRRAKTVDEVKSTFGLALQNFGSHSFVICDIPAGAPPGVRELHASNWSEAWQQRYVERDYAMHDPIPNNVGRQINPYYWHEAAEAFKDNSIANRIMAEARSDFGMGDGFCVPIHGLTSVAGLISISTPEKNWILSEEENAAIHMISIYAYEAIRRLRTTRPSGGGGPVLSARETECLRWTAEGKTAWEISCILGISEETATKYLKNVAKKLGTRTKAHTVSRAYRLHLLQ